MAQSGKHAHVNTCDCVHAVHVSRAFLVRCENLDAITSKQVTEENYECLSLQYRATDTSYQNCLLHCVEVPLKSLIVIV